MSPDTSTQPVDATPSLPLAAEEASSVAPKADRATLAGPGPDSWPPGGWPAVGAITFAAFALITLEFLPIGLLPEIGAALGVSDGTAGLMVTAPALVAAAAAPLVAMRTAHLDRRRVLLALTLLTIGSAALAAASGSFALMLVSRLFVGFAIGGFWAIGPGLAMGLVPAHRATRATAVVLIGVSAGTVVGLPAGTAIGQLVGWRGAFLVTAALGALALVAQLRLLPPLRGGQPLVARDLLAVARVPAARTGLILTVLVFAGHFAGYAFIAPFLTDDVGMSPGGLSALLLLYGAAGVAGNAAFTVLAERAVRRGLAVAVGLLGGAVALALVAGASPVAAGVAIVFWGLAFGGLPLLLQTWVFDAIDRAQDGGAALFITVLQLAIAGGTLLGGVLVGSVEPRGVLVITMVAAVAALAVIAATGRTRPVSRAA